MKTLSAASPVLLMVLLMALGAAMFSWLSDTAAMDAFGTWMIGRQS